MYFDLFDFLLEKIHRIRLWFHLIQCLLCALAKNGLLQDSILMGLAAQSPSAVCAFTGEAGWRNCFSPFPFTLKPVPWEEFTVSTSRSITASPLYGHVLCEWKKEKVQAFSLSEPVHWIIHTKRFLLEEGQGGEGCSTHWPFYKRLCPGRGSRLWEGNPWSGWGMVAAVCLRIYLHQPKAYTLPFAPYN